MANIFAKSYGAVLLLVAVIIVVFCAGPAQPMEPRKSVLVLHSYHQGLSWTDSITEGIVERFHRDGLEVEWTFEYMDTKRFTGSEHYANLERLYKYKYRNSAFDVIISSDDNAYRFLLAHGQDIFPGIPVVFCGVNGFKADDIKGKDNFTGVEEDFDFKATLEAALSLKDGLKKIVVLVDRTTSGQANLDRLKPIIAEIGRKATFKILDNYSMEEVQQFVARLGSEAIIFWLHFTQDNTGRFYSFEDSSEMVSQASGAPLYSSWDFHMNHGIVGGMITSGKQQGETAARLAERVLAGEKVSTIPVVSKSPNQYMFDYLQLERFKIDPKRLPVGSVLINKPETFIGKHGRLLGVFCAGFLILGCIILLLSVSNMRRLRAEKLATAAKNRYLGIFNDTSIALMVEDLTALIGDLQEIERKAKGDYRSYLANDKNHLFSLGSKIRVRDANPAALKLYGIKTKAELAGILTRLVGAGDKEALVDFMVALLERRDRYVVETVNKTLGGEQLNVILEVKLPRDYDEYDSVLVSVVNITERKKAEEALAVSETRFRTAFDSAATGMALLTVSGEYQQVNQALCSILGYREEELVGRTWRDVTHPDDLKETEYFIEKLIAKRISAPFEKRYISKTGEIIWALYNGAIIQDSEGKPVNLISQFQDITLRKQAEAELLEQTERYRKYFEDDLAGVFACSDKGTILNCNLAFREMFNLPEGVEEKKVSFFKFFSDETEGHNFFNTLARQGKLVYYELQLFDTSGSPLEVVINAIGRFARSGKLQEVQGYVMDVTQQRALERQLLQAQKLESIGTMAGGIAHDFNNLLMGIMGNVSLMLLEKDKIHPDFNRLKNIEEYAWSGSSLTRKLLGFAKGGKYEVKTFDINEILRSNSDLFNQTHKNIKVDLDFRAKAANVDVDKSQIDQVFYNLYVNAFQAMTDGGKIAIRTRDVELGDEFTGLYEAAPGNYVKIEVEDDGEGMNKETLRRIFDPFFTTKEIGRGTGLGLASSYGIIQNHSGIITVESEVGTGSCFTIYLPVSDGQPVRLGDAERLTNVVAGREKILLVDDEQMILEIGRQMLEALGYDIICAENGEEAVALYKKERKSIDLIILDMIMPTMSGGVTFDRLKEIDAHVKVILSSGYSLDEKAQAIMERGCLAFMQKPFDLQKLSEKVRQILDSGSRK